MVPKRKLNVTTPPGYRNTNRNSRPGSDWREKEERTFSVYRSIMDRGPSFCRPGPCRGCGNVSGRNSATNDHQSEQGKPGRKVFDVFSWYPNYQSCQRYFLGVAQFDYACLALAAFLNIKLPHQRLDISEFKPSQPVSNSAQNGEGLPSRFRMGYSPAQPSASQHMLPLPIQQGGHQQPADHLPFGHVSLLPYIRRLVVTGYDADGVMHGWFGDDWMAGLNPLLESERQNYMFAAKSSDWLTLKKTYDTITEESVPFLVPLQRATEAEILRAEDVWSSMLSMRDWMIGPRSLDGDLDHDETL